MLSWFLAVAAATAPTAACPSGDAPADASDLAVDDVRFDVSVGDDDVAHVRAHLRLKNTSAGPGMANVLVAVEEPRAPVVATAGRIRGHAASVLVDDVDAAESDFEAFADALQYGVEPALARGGRERAALLVEHAPGGFSVRVAAACSARVIDVDIDAVVAADHHDGVARLTLPLLAPRTQVTVTSARPAWIGGHRGKSRSFAVDDDAADGIDDHASVDIDVDGRDVFGPQATSAITTLRRAPLPPQEGDPPLTPEEQRAARAPFTLAHTAVSLPAPLSATPPELRVVFVVDASVSAADGGLDRALSLAGDLVRALPNDAGYALIAAARTPRLVVPPWQPAGRWRAPHIDVENGSELPAAVALAHKMARDALPGSGRVIVLSDLQLATAHLERHTFARSLQGGPLAHVLALAADVGEGGHQGPLSWTRVFGDDGDSYLHSDAAAAAESTGGVMLDVDDGDDDRAALALSLVRPTSFDRPTLVFGDAADQSTRTVWHAGDDAIGDEWPAFVREGEGIAASMVVDGAAAGHVEGYVWGHKVVLPLVSSPDRAARAALLGRAINTDLNVDDDLARAVAVADGFVSRATSLLHVPAFRPAATEARGGVAFACGCGGTCGGSCTGGSSCGLRTSKAELLAEPAILQALGARIAERCGVDVDANIEVSDLEILHVSVRQGGACAREALWAARLDQLTPGDGSFEAHRLRTVTGAHPPVDAEAAQP